MVSGKCIICGNDSDGALVADTHVIRAIRALKKKFGVAQNNTLVVCKNCEPVHAQKRKKFEGNWAMNAVLIAAIVFFVGILPVFVGAAFSPAALLLSIALGIFIGLLSLVFYVPPIAKTGMQASAQPAKTSASGKQKQPPQAAHPASQKVKPGQARKRN